MNQQTSTWRAFFNLKSHSADANSPAGCCYASAKQQRLLLDIFRELCASTADAGLVLDVGCGNGLFTQSLYGSRRGVVGVDVSDEMCCLAKSNGIVACSADANQLPFSDEQFDLVYGSEMLQHIDDLHDILTEVARVCRPGAKVVFSIGNRTSLVRYAARVLRRIAPRPD